MNTSKMHVMHDIDDYCKAHNISYAALAELIFKDTAVIKRQLTETRGGVQLNTAYELAAAIGGIVKFIPPDALGETVSAERDELNDQITKLTDTVSAQEREIEKLHGTIDMLQKRVIQKDERLERKDDLIRQLLIEKNVIRE